MRFFLIIYIMCISSCSAHLFKPDNISLTLNCYVEKEKIKLEFINDGTKKIFLFKPCLTNTLIKIKDDSLTEIPPKVLLRRDCDTHLFELSENETAIFFYPYILSELYDLKKGSEYEMNVEYFIYQKGKVKKKLQRKCSFIW